MTKFILAGRRDVNDYFELSGVFSTERLTHTPFLVFTVNDDTFQVHIVDKPHELLTFSDETPVMGQWPGERRSDFFQFTVGQYRAKIEAEQEPLKTARNVVKLVGPQGGFRSLSYDLTDKAGKITHQVTVSKPEAERLEKFFAKHQILVEVKRS